MTLCIAIVKPVGKEITDEAIRNSAASNRDGGGYAFVGPKGKLVVKKGYFNVEKFIEDYRADEALYGSTSPALLHFRISTGGGVTVDNCHPFEYKHGALIHNGYFFSGSADKSDTRILVEAVGDKLTAKNVKEHSDKLSKAFAGSKVAILFKDRSFAIINEPSGMWDGGVWYSNGSFRRGVVSTRPTAGPVHTPGGAVRTPVAPSCAIPASSNLALVGDADDEVADWELEWGYRAGELTRTGGRYFPGRGMD